MFEFLKKLCNIGQYKEEVKGNITSPSRTIKCNATSCMDNENGECILSWIQINVEDGKAICADYSEQDSDIVNAFKKEIGIVEITKVNR
jgi:hypothetical protein